MYYLVWQQQIEYLQGLLSYPCADELALDFHEAALLADSRLKERDINEAECHAIKLLDAKLAQMSGSARAHLWTPEALVSASDWDEVRKLAAVALALLLRQEK